MKKTHLILTYRVTYIYLLLQSFLTFIHVVLKNYIFAHNCIKLHDFAVCCYLVVVVVVVTVAVIIVFSKIYVQRKAEQNYNSSNNNRPAVTPVCTVITDKTIETIWSAIIALAFNQTHYHL